MEWPVNPTQEEAQRFFAHRTNGHTWELLDQATRTASLELQARGHGIRQIARTLGSWRGAVRTQRVC